VIKALKRCGIAPLFLTPLLAANPGQARTYADPATDTVLWQMAAALLIACLYFVRPLIRLARNHLSLESRQTRGFLFATAFSIGVSPVAMRLFGGNPLPRFNDVFLVGIVLTAYLFTWEASAYLLGISILISAWVLPPYGTFWIEGAAEWYRLASFSLISVFLILVITRKKDHSQRDSVEETETDTQRSPVAGAAAGD
jgi:hypothetical protein